MKISLRALLILIAVFAVTLGWLVHSLSSLNVDFASNGNDVSFSDAQFAKAASEMHFALQVDSVLIAVDGVRRNATPNDNVARFNIQIQGTIGRSVPGLQPIWPFTQSEFADMIETELEIRLGKNSKPEYVFKTLPMPE